MSRKLSKSATFDISTTIYFFTLILITFSREVSCLSDILNLESVGESENNLGHFSQKYYELLALAKCKAKCHTINDTLPKKASNKILFVKADCATESCRNCLQCFEDPSKIIECGGKANTNEEKENVCEKFLLNQKEKSKKNDTLSFFSHFPSPQPIFRCSFQEKESLVSVSFYINYKTQDSLQTIIDNNSDYVPRLFIVETETDGVWNGGDTFITQYWTFNIITRAEKIYRVRITPVSPMAVYKPSLSTPFQSYEMKDRIAKNPINPRIIQYTFDSWSENPNAILGWESGAGLNASCKSRIYLLSEEDFIVSERLTVGEAFWIEFKHLKYGRTYEVRIIDLYAPPNLEMLTNYRFVVPKCRELSKFRERCHPEEPSNLVVSNMTSSSFFLNWKHENDKNGNESHRVVAYYRMEAKFGLPAILATDKLFFNRSIEGYASSIEIPFPLDKFYINESLTLFFVATLLVENSNGKSEKALVGFQNTFFGPSEPTNLAITNISTTSFILSWDSRSENRNKSWGKDSKVSNQFMSFDVVVTYKEVSSQLRPLDSSPQNPIAKMIFLKTSLPSNVNSIEVLFPLEVIKITNLSRVFNFDIGIVTKGEMGCSKKVEISFTHHFKGLFDEMKAQKTSQSVHHLSIWNPLSMIFLACLIIIFIILFFIFMMKDLRKRRERKQNRRKYFEGLDKESIEFNVLTLDKHNLQWEINLDDLTFGENIGEGAFGIVKKALLQRNGERTMVAVKTLRHGVRDNKDSGHFWEEFDILQNLDRHRNVVALMGVVKGSVPALVVEYCPGGDLQTFLRKAHRAASKSKTMNSSKNKEMDGSQNNEEDVKSRLPMVTNLLYFLDRAEDDDEILVSEHDLLSFARQVSCGMEFLEKNKIVHRDLAARNVLIGVNAVLKIGDFGLSRDIYEQNLYKKNSKGMIPIKWLAIESLLQQIYTAKSDVWSFGILLWEIVTFGGSPYPGIDNGNIFDLLSSGYRMQRPDNCSEEIYALMKECWHEDSKDRPNFQIIHSKLDKLIEKSSVVTYISIMPNRESFHEPDECEETRCEKI